MKCAKGCGNGVFSSRTNVCKRCRERHRNGKRVGRVQGDYRDLPAATIDAMLKAGDDARRKQRWSA